MMFFMNGFVNGWMVKSSMGKVVVKVLKDHKKHILKDQRLPMRGEEMLMWREGVDKAGALAEVESEAGIG